MHFKSGYSQRSRRAKAFRPLVGGSAATAPNFEPSRSLNEGLLSRLEIEKESPPEPPGLLDRDNQDGDKKNARRHHGSEAFAPDRLEPERLLGLV